MEPATIHLNCEANPDVSSQVVRVLYFDRCLDAVHVMRMLDWRWYVFNVRMGLN